MWLLQAITPHAARITTVNTVAICTRRGCRRHSESSSGPEGRLGFMAIPSRDRESIMSGQLGTNAMSNRLADQTSPYLQQHADNPVDWYPWGEEALARARV